MKKTFGIFIGIIGLMISGSAFAEHGNIQTIELTPGSTIEIQPAVQTRIICGQDQGGGGSRGGLVSYCKCVSAGINSEYLYLIFMNQEGKEVKKDLMGYFTSAECLKQIQTDVRCR